MASQALYLSFFVFKGCFVFTAVMLMDSIVKTLYFCLIDLNFCLMVTYCLLVLSHPLTIIPCDCVLLLEDFVELILSQLCSPPQLLVVPLGPSESFSVLIRSCLQLCLLKETSRAFKYVTFMLLLQLMESIL